MHQTKQNCIVCIVERRTQKFTTELPDFQFKVVWITSLAHAKCLFKIIFGHDYFIGDLIFKIYAALFTIFGLQQDDMVIFFLWCFRKVRF